VSPEEISRHLDGLRAAGEALRRRPAEQTLRALERLLDIWRDPGSACRRELEARLPAATGFTTATVREGLSRGLEAWSGKALRDLVLRELGPPEQLDAAKRNGPLVSGFGTTALLLAGSIPMPTLMALIPPLVLRSPVLVKSASRDPVTAPLVVRTLRGVDPELAGCIAVVDFPGDDDGCMRALLEADCVIATGSDETVAAVAARLRPPRRLVSYGHRLSVAALGDAATRGEALERAAVGLALDVALWDQQGCLSPIAVYVASPDGAAADRVAKALAAALADAETDWPRGAVAEHAAVAIAHERASAELREAAGRRVSVHAGEAWTVVREEDARLRPAPLHRFVRVHPVEGPEALLEALAPLGPHLAAIGLDGFGEAPPGLPRALADLGASRLCPVGMLQCPPLSWHHEGLGVLAPLARFTDLEA
jgi:acyl-CoA reductase-like NAD-dependent aldehyde dehydrogenase